MERLSMLSKMLAPGFVLMLAAAPADRAIVAAQGDTLTIGVALPHGQMGLGTDISAPLLQSLMTNLRGANLLVVALESGDIQQAVAEGAQKNCAYVLLTRVAQSHGKMGGGLMSKMSMLKPSKTPNYGLTPTGDAQGTETLIGVEHTAIKSG